MPAMIVTFCVAAFWCHAQAVAGDWPQILGPARNGVAADETIVREFGQRGPAVAWQRAVGEGFAGVAVAGGRAVIFHRVGDEEIAEALDAKSGAPIWKKAFPATYEGGYSNDHGPRASPVIGGGSVYLFGAAGDVHALSLKDGSVKWSRPLARECRAPDGYFGAGSTPLVEGDKLLINVGGREGTGLVALSLADGKTVWKSTEEQASYSSPVAVTLDGVRHVIFVTRYSALSIDPGDGRVRWQFPFGARGPTVNAATPVVVDGHLFVTASYGVGAVCAHIGREKAVTVWQNNETMSSQYSTCVAHEGALYGIDGRQDVGSARLRSIDLKTGRVLWTREDYGVAHLIRAGETLVILKDDGTLVLAAPSPREYRELARARILDSTARALPAISNGLLYVRDTSTLKCLDLRGGR